MMNEINLGDLRMRSFSMEMDAFANNNSGTQFATPNNMEDSRMQNLVLDEKQEKEKVEKEKYVLKNPKERVASYIYELKNIDENSLFDSCRE